MKLFSLSFVFIGLLLSSALSGWDFPQIAEMWDLSDAERVVTPMRERICLNGLWQFYPVDAPASTAPAAEQYPYFFKVPGVWPGFDGWGQPGSHQRIYLPGGSEAEINGQALKYVWHRRTFTIPEGAETRKKLLELSLIQIHAQIFIDGVRAGELAFPGGTLDITPYVKPGQVQELAILAAAQTEGLKQFSFSDKDRVHVSEKIVRRRGLVGDVYLRLEPQGVRLDDVHIITSVKNKDITFETGFTEIPPAGSYLETVVSDAGRPLRTFRSDAIRAKDGRFRYTAKWLAPKLWTPEHPENLYTATVSLKDASGNTLDTLYPEEFGFREIRIEGRNLTLNGKIIRLMTTPSLTPWYGAGASMPENFERTARLMREYGLNHFYALNYDFSPGDVCYQDAFYKENSKVGILTTLTLPNPVPFHFNTPEEIAAYTRRLKYQIRRYQNVPGVILYASTHNAAGFIGSDESWRLGTGDTNGTYVWKPRNNVIAKAAEKIIREMDASRPLYHHSSGIFGEITTLNCYLNWMPLQERRDYLLPWSQTGETPLIFVEYGIPHLPAWTSFRGPGFIWSGPQVMSVWLNEYLAQYTGEEAYRLDGVQKQFLDMQYRAFGGRKVSMSQYNWLLKSPAVQKVQAQMLRETLPYFRLLGLSGLALWDHYALWENTVTNPVCRPERFRNLKRTGISADYQFTTPLDFGTGPTGIGKAVQEVYRPQLGMIVGRQDDPTSQHSYYLKGETVEKSLAFLNDTMHEAEFRCDWEVPELNLKNSVTVRVDAGERKLLPVSFRVPESAPAALTFRATFYDPDKQSTHAELLLTVGEKRNIALTSPLLVFDPEGSTKQLLRELKLSFRETCGESVTPGTILIIGRNAIDGLPFDLGQIAAAGMKVMILEQSHNTLWHRFGIRSTEYGLRNLFAVSPKFDGKPLRNWRGSSTLKPPCSRRDEWLGQKIHGNIQAGYRGALATVVPEKPCVGDWMPLLHGGFDLSYAPLLEFREEKAHLLFCQLDVSNRTVLSPEALELFSSALEYLDQSTEKSVRRTFYSGNAEGEAVLKTLKIKYRKLQDPTECTGNDLLILAPGFQFDSLQSAVKNGLHVLALGLDKEEIDTAFPEKTKAGIWQNTYSYPAEGLGKNPLLIGISNADLFWRKPISATFFNESNAPALKYMESGAGKVVFVQAVPWLFDADEFQLRTTLRRNYGLISRLAHNLGAESRSGLLERLSHPPKLFFAGWRGKADPDRQGMQRNFFSPSFRPGADWKPIQVPGAFDTASNGLAGYDGDFWYRTTFNVPEIPSAKETTLFIGRVDDFSKVWLNGKFLGEVTDKTNPDDYWLFSRSYKIPSSLLRKQNNTLVVLCTDLRGSGGIFQTPWLQLKDSDLNLYSDTPRPDDDPYRYYHW